MNNGAFGENFPYSNFHDLNMDWIIKIAKDFLDQYTNIQEVIEEGETSLQNLTTSGLEQLQTKADDLEALLQQWYDTHSEDIADQLADALTSAITAFNTAAENKTAEAIASIPADYSTLSETVSNLERQTNAETSIPVISGKYITADGQGLLNTTTGNGAEFNVEEGVIVVYSGDCYFTPIWGYDENDTPYPLYYSDTPVHLSGQEILITNPNIIKVKAWGLNNLDSQYTRPFSITVRGTNSAITDLQTLREPATDGVYESAKYITPAGVIATGDGGSGNTICTFNNVQAGDQFLYTGFYPTNSWGLVWGYKANGTAVKLLDGISGIWNVENVYRNRLITITDSEIVKVVAWSELHDPTLPISDIPFTLTRCRRTPLENKRVFTVSKAGDGDFTFIEDAIEFCKTTFDEDEPVEIVIAPGVYNVKGRTQFNGYALDKGANAISISGSGRDNTVIQWVGTEFTNRLAVLNVGGPCTIKDMTIKQIYASNNISQNFTGNAYAVHNDTPYLNDAPSDFYTTEIHNCKIQSNMFNPVGGGLRGLQIQRYSHCEFVFDTRIPLYKQWGALYVHGPANHDVTLCELIVDSCIMRSYDQKALALPNVTGSLQYTSIPVTIDKCIGVTGGSEITDVSRTTHALTTWSQLNNVDEWNY